MTTCGCRIHHNDVGATSIVFCSLHAQAHAMVEALRNMLMYADTGRTETRWTEKDRIAEPGTLVNHDTVRAILRAVEEG